LGDATSFGVSRQAAPIRAPSRGRDCTISRHPCLNSFPDALQADASGARAFLLHSIGVKPYAAVLDPELQRLAITHQRNTHLGSLRVLCDVGE